MALPQDKQHDKREAVVRIVSTDVPGNATIYSGLTKIKGVSWTISNAMCKELKLDKKRKVSTLSEEELEKITKFLKEMKLPEWMLNRRKDRETGIAKHLITTELDLQKEFDIRRMKKIKCYKGVRHILGQPVRGQRTRGHFRKKGRTVGVTRQKAAPAKAK